MGADALVENASNPADVARAKVKTRLAKRDERGDLRAVLATPEGARFIWRELERCKVFGSTYDDHAPRMAYQAGRQDVGHELIALINAADPDAMFRLMAAQRKAEKTNREENEAVHGHMRRDAGDFDA